MSEMINEKELQEEITSQPLDEFLENAYRRYAILTILDRALPDVRDGLKPVQRRILFAMHYMNITSKAPHKKSARVVGEVMGKYHPHGDQSIYDAMVRMAQEFSMRDPLVDGQGNYGSIDGDKAAAMRYTEARLTALGEAMLRDIEKDTVTWQANFDDTLKEPTVLPSRFPNLLVNGSNGIAVGMATSILPHNLGEICDAVTYICKNWKKRNKISIEKLMEFIPGPDLPTGGLLFRFRPDKGSDNVDMIKKVYETGRGTLICQSRADIREISGGKSEIIVTELPYQAQKNTILERVAAHKEKFPGLTDVRDESDYHGMRVIFEVGRNGDPHDVLEKLLSNTQMRNSLSHNALALVQETNGDDETYAEPRYLSLLEFLNQFVAHRLDVITKRAKYDLKRAEDRLHIVEGLLKALSNIDEVVAIIRKSQTTDTAKKNLMKKLDLSAIQAQAILDMPLRRLVSLERKKLVDEEKELKATIRGLKKILASETSRLELVIDETAEIKADFATPRRTVIISSEEGHEASITEADLVRPDEAQMVRITQKAILRSPSKGFRDNGVEDKPTSRAVEIDFFRMKLQPEQKVVMVSSKGRMWYGPVGRIPEHSSFGGSGLARGESIVGLDAASPDKYLALLTSEGNVKRVSFEDIDNLRTEGSWVQIIGLQNADDEVLFAGACAEEDEMLIGTGGSEQNSPRMLRINLNTINPQATPSAKGVIGIKMLDDVVIGANIIQKELSKKLFVVLLTENGWAKKVPISEYPTKGRGSQGVQTWKVTPESGYVIDFALSEANSKIDIYSAGYKRLRIKANNLPKASSRIVKGQDLPKKYGLLGTLFGEDRVIGLSVIQ